MEPQPVLSEEYIASLRAMITAAVNEAFNKHFGPQQATQATRQCTPPTPQAKKEEVKKLRPRPLYQATVEDDTEHGNSMLANKSILSSFLYLYTTRASRDSAAYISKLLTSSFGSFFGSFLTSLFGSPLASFSASRFGFGYIECIASMEASGQG